MRDAERSAKQYDAMATKYSTSNDEGVYNALYERPAMLSLIGDVKGRQVLDVGCGAGQLSIELVDRGASVTGIDVSPAMIEIARERAGDRAGFEVGDASAGLAYDDDSFDLIVLSLMIHYIEDWVPLFAELGRLLAAGGRVVFSTHHPTMDWKLASPDNYFSKTQFTDVWTKGGTPFEVTFWRRPLSAMSDEIRRGGFVIQSIDEPMPTETLAEVGPEQDTYLRTKPHFLFVSLVPAE